MRRSILLLPATTLVVVGACSPYQPPDWWTPLHPGQNVAQDATFDLLLGSAVPGPDVPLERGIELVDLTAGRDVRFELDRIEGRGVTIRPSDPLPAEHTFVLRGVNSDKFAPPLRGELRQHAQVCLELRTSTTLRPLFAGALEEEALRTGAHGAWVGFSTAVGELQDGDAELVLADGRLVPLDGWSEADDARPWLVAVVHDEPFVAIVLHAGLQAAGGVALSEDVALPVVPMDREELAWWTAGGAGGWSGYPSDVRTTGWCH